MATSEEFRGEIVRLTGRLDVACSGRLFSVSKHKMLDVGWLLKEVHHTMRQGFALAISAIKTLRVQRSDPVDMWSKKPKEAIEISDAFETFIGHLQLKYLDQLTWLDRSSYESDRRKELNRLAECMVSAVSS